MAEQTAPPSPQGPRLPTVLAPMEGERLADDLTWTGVEVTGDIGAGVEAADVEITESRLVGCDLAGTAVERLRMSDVVLDGCDLSGALLYDALMRRVELRDCRMSGTVLAGARLHDVRFVGCKAEEANFRSIQGERVVFDDTILRGADLNSSTITDGALLGCDLTRADVRKAKLPGAPLHGSILDDLVGADHLRGVRIDGTQIVPLALRLFAALGVAVDD